MGYGILGFVVLLNDSGKQVYFRYLLNAFRYWFVIERGERVLGLQDGVGS